jgi:methyl-accepting chemotaxis protein
MVLWDKLEKLSAKTIHVRLFVLMLLLLAGSFSIMGVQQGFILTSAIESDALEKAKSDLMTGMAILDAKFPGEWSVRDGFLYKGDVRMNDNHELVDWIGELTGGDTVTLFLGDTRVATNVTADGRRAVGTKASKAVAERVLGKGEPYYGAAEVLGNTYQAAYMPIRDAGGAVIGMWYVGAPDADERIRGVKRNSAWWLAAAGRAQANARETAGIMERMAVLLKASADGTGSMAAMVEELTATSDQMAASAVHLSELADRMQTMVDAFRT